MAAQAAGFKSLHPSRLQLSNWADRARFFTSWLRRIAPDTHQDHASGQRSCRPPWRLRRPRRTLVPQRVQGVHHRPVAAEASAPIPGWLTLRAIRLHCKPVTANAAAHSDQGGCRSSAYCGLAGRRRYSCEAARHIKRFALLQHVEARPRQLVRRGLDGHHVIGLRLLPLVEPLRFGTVPQ